MINLFHKKGFGQSGAATLLMSIILISSMTLIILFAASYGIMQQKISSNSYRYLQAYEASEAGLEFAIPYLDQNRATILANPVAGYIPVYTNSATQNVVLGNNSRFSITYTNPIANNYNLIKITVTGLSDDSSSSLITTQLVQYDSFLMTVPTSSLVAKGSVILSGSSQVINTSTNNNITSGSTITIQGSGNTVTSNPLVSSTSSGLKSDVTQNNSTIAAMTNTEMFTSYFGVDQTSFKNNVDHYYNNNSNTNYNSVLDGKTNTIIWIDQTAGEARIDGNTVIGSVTQPVLIVVNGDLRLSGSATIYGLVYVVGGTQTDAIGNSEVVGALVNAGDLKLSGSAKLTYSANVLNAIQQNIGFFAKVPGSWMDF